MAKAAYPAARLRIIIHDDPEANVLFEVVDGGLKIDPAKITVKVAGHTGTVEYDGDEHAVEGYDLSCVDALYDEDKVVFTGEAVAKGTEVGDYPMDLAESQFGYDDSNVTVRFELTDGWLIITSAPGPGPEPGSHTITYDPNGGIFRNSIDPTSIEYADGEIIDIAEAPTREGYTFLYWKGSEYQPGDKFMVTEDHTFEAQWQKNGDGPPDDPSVTPYTGDSPLIIFVLALFVLSTLSVAIAMRKQSASNR